jgi:molybdopterin-containing oxidoreductase family iron-sulfur binding subunit
MNQSRRTFLKTAGLCAASLALASPAQAAGPSYAEGPEALKAGRWAMVLDTRRLASPALQQRIIEACHSYHNVPDIQGRQEVKWIWSESYAGAFTEKMDDYPAKAVAERRYLLLCNHCENPPCVRVCPTRATFKRPDGIVEMDYHRCIGCRFCMAGCPYGSRSFNFSDALPHLTQPNPEFPARARGVVEKCTFCSELLAKGKDPLCVAASEGAILFGDLSDPGSAVRKALAANLSYRRKPSLGTGPSVYYIL